MKVDDGGKVIFFFKNTPPQKFRWVDEYTRAVFVDFSIYSPTINKWCIVRLTFEFLNAGGILPSATIRILNLTRCRFISPLIPFFFWRTIHL